MRTRREQSDRVTIFWTMAAVLGIVVGGSVLTSCARQYPNTPPPTGAPRDGEIYEKLIYLGKTPEGCTLYGMKQYIDPDPKLVVCPTSVALR